MSKLLVCSLVLAVCTTCAFAGANDMPSLPPPADPTGPLTVGNFALNGPCVGGNDCTYFLGNDGFAATGSGNFNANVFGSAQVTYSFITPLPTSWTDDGFTYSATFGMGGSFDMSLPNGMTFTGVVTSGLAGYEGLTSEVQVNYAGQWSDGQYATGSVYEYELGYGPNQSLNETTSLGAAGTSQASTPEPSSFLLLGSAIFGAWGWKRKSIS